MITPNDGVKDVRDKNHLTRSSSDGEDENLRSTKFMSPKPSK